MTDPIADPGEELPQGSCIRVLIVDDHAVVRRGLATCLAVFDDLELVGEAIEGKAAMKLCEQLEREQRLPDVVLMDLVMPGMNGVVATRLITERWPWVRVIALTSFEADNLLENACQAGVSAYLLKNVSSEELVQAIRDAYAAQPAA